MRSKLKYIGLGIIIGIVLILGISATATDFRMGRTMEILVNMVREISTSYVDAPDADKLLRDAADGMSSGLDPYTQFLDEEDLEGFEIMTTGRYAGIGSTIRQRGDTILFAEPYKGSPADEAGIRIGDAILEIDGKSVVGSQITDVSEALKGEAGSVVKVTYKRLTDDSIQSVDIRRETIVRSGVVYSAMLNDTTGYINHTDFIDNVSHDFRVAVDSLMAAGATKIVIDERGNGGGILQEAVKILSLFLPRGTKVVEMRGRNASDNHTFYTKSEPVAQNISLVVLINEMTASAAEILAGGLQDLGRAKLVGRNSFGKGVVQGTRPLGYNTYLKLTTARYYLPSGRTLEQGIGLTPDIATTADTMNRLTYELYGAGFLDDFADNYWKQNQNMNISDPAIFTLSDADWADFKQFVSNKLPANTDIDLDSVKEQVLPMLTSNIILRYLYVEGVYARNVSQDAEIKLAVKL